MNRAAQALEPLQVKPLGRGCFRVTGGRAPHVIELSQDVARCDCGDYVYRRRQCKHLAAVVEYLILATNAGPGLEVDVPLPESPTMHEEVEG